MKHAARAHGGASHPTSNSVGSDEFLQHQIELHRLVRIDEFHSLEDYCLYLMHARSYEEAARFAGDNVILDLGCNNGYGTAKLAETAERVVGVDVSPAAIADAHRRFPDLDYRVVDGMQLPFDNETFDLVVSMQVIEHIVDQATYLGEIVRVLKRGGVAVFATPNAAVRLDPGMKPWNTTHFHEFTAAELQQLLNPRFAAVTVQGLFAKEPLYSLEFNRVQRARSRARRRDARRASSRLRQRIRALLPDTLVDAVRRARHRVTTPQPKRLADEVLQMYSIADFFYQERRLDDALDLMAICRK
jgi:SAM-dependent methyltransferase